MILFLAAVLAATPAAPPRTTQLRARLDVAGMISSSWYVPESRAHIEVALSNVKGSFLGQGTLDGEALLLALPVVGPLRAAFQDGPLEQSERVMLSTAGLLQLAGISWGSIQLIERRGEVRPRGPVLSVSPIAAGRLGVSVRIVGF